ncbi:InlB B-repeat-containing protein [Breznakia pachnodae]|uniref:Repeat protein (TIGR02543 family) n=1 Tax=Breznakia pachnodae TaxID=265178 RepID=A0ABU0E4W2_9FIRM|nr:InlB B-repeat-containing protein [Breznakia pachnodae]MDQ0361761.1 putative repeat protein (TIGR02543 family) [Breznakia pachnodae]
MKKVYKKVLLVFVSLLVAVQFSSSWILAEGDIINTNDYEEEVDETIAEDPSEETKLDEQAPTDVTDEADKKDETESTEGDKATENVVEDNENVEENSKVEKKTTVQGKSALNRTVESETLGTFSELFADENLAKYVADYSGKSVDSQATQADLDLVDYIYSYGDDTEISDLSGIHLLKNLTTIELSNTKIANFDAIHDLPNLSSIRIYEARNLKTINGMKNLPNINNISINNSSIKEIGNFDNSVQIDYLSVTNSDLYKVNDLSNQTELNDLNVCDNKLTTLDNMGKLTNLSYLDISNNSITSLNSLDAPMLNSLTANDNKLTSVNGLSNSTDLSSLELQNNSIRSVASLIDCTNVSYLNIENNSLQSVEGLQNMDKLSYGLNLSNNEITNLSAFTTNSLKINSLYLDNNKLTSLDGVESITALQSLSAENNNLENINAINELSNLSYLNVNNNNISSVTLSNEMNNLAELHIANNKLKNIDFLSKCSHMMMYGYTLDLSNNMISSLSVFEEFTTVSISSINLSDNQITSLESLKDLEQSSINNLIISNNKLTSLYGINNDTSIPYLDASYNPLEGEDALEALNNIAGSIYTLNLSHAQITNEMFDKVKWEDMTYFYGSLDLSYNELEHADVLYTKLISVFPYSYINLAGNKYDSFDFIIGNSFEYLDLSGTGFKDFEILNKATSIGGLGLSSNDYTDEDLEEFSKLNIDTIVNLSTLDLSSNKITKLDFLKYFAKEEDYKRNSNLEVILDHNDFSSLDVSVLDLFNNDEYYGAKLRLSMVDSNISDLSGFEGKKYDFDLRLQLDENHISDISPLFTYFEFLVDKEPEDNNREFELSIQNQTVTADNEVSDKDTLFTIENIVKQLNSGIVEPSFISNEGSYNDPNVTWNLADVSVEDGYAKTYYDFTTEIGTYENTPATRSISLFTTPAPAGEPMYFSGRVTINTKINSSAEEDTYKITYDGNKHTSGDAPVDTTEYDANASVSVLGQNTLKKTGYTFLGWSEDANATAADYKENDTLTITSDVTLYAVWKLDEDPTNPVDPVDPVEPTDPTDPVKPTDPTTPEKPTEPSESVASGDTTNLYLWLSLATIAGLASLLVLKKKREESK